MTGRAGVADYMYFAAAVSTTFGTTDVNVVSRRLRRDVAMHGIVVFVFNTVIIVVALSLVTGDKPWTRGSLRPRWCSELP